MFVLSSKNWAGADGLFFNAPFQTMFYLLPDKYTLTKDFRVTIVVVQYTGYND